MLYFEPTKIKSVIPRVSILCAEAQWMPETPEEEFCPGNPVDWDDLLPKCFKHEFLRIFRVDFCSVPANMCSRITEYKQIWGLRHLPKGVYEMSFAYPMGKIYCGVSKLVDWQAFRQCGAPVCMLQKTDDPLDFGKLSDTFQIACKPDFTEKDCAVLAGTLENRPDLVLLRYWWEDSKIFLCVVADAFLIGECDLPGREEASMRVHPRYFLGTWKA